jgi:hypothetical protein
MTGNGHVVLGLAEALRLHPGLSIRPRKAGCVTVAGELQVNHCAAGFHAIEDAFEIEMRVPGDFPRTLPEVRELGGRIPNSFHTNSDGTLCLGSPIRLRMHAGPRPPLTRFIERCVIPYLYGFEHQERHGVLPFGELGHRNKHVVEDLKGVFRVQDLKACVGLIRLAGMQRRKANRCRCPCNSGNRVGQCHHRILNHLRARCGRLSLKVEHLRLTQS